MGLETNVDRLPGFHTRSSVSEVWNVDAAKEAFLAFLVGENNKGTLKLDVLRRNLLTWIDEGEDGDWKGTDVESFMEINEKAFELIQDIKINEVLSSSQLVTSTKGDSTDYQDDFTIQQVAEGQAERFYGSKMEALEEPTEGSQIPVEHLEHQLAQSPHKDTLQVYKQELKELQLALQLAKGQRSPKKGEHNPYDNMSEANVDKAKAQLEKRILEVGQILVNVSAKEKKFRRSGIGNQLEMKLLDKDVDYNKEEPLYLEFAFTYGGVVDGGKVLRANPDIASNELGFETGRSRAGSRFVLKVFDNDGTPKVVTTEDYGLVQNEDGEYEKAKKSLAKGIIINISNRHKKQLQRSVAKALFDRLQKLVAGNTYRDDGLARQHMTQKITESTWQAVISIFGFYHMWTSITLEDEDLLLDVNEFINVKSLETNRLRWFSSLHNMKDAQALSLEDFITKVLQGQIDEGFARKVDEIYSWLLTQVKSLNEMQEEIHAQVEQASGGSRYVHDKNTREAKQQELNKLKPWVEFWEQHAKSWDTKQQSFHKQYVQVKRINQKRPHNVIQSMEQMMGALSFKKGQISQMKRDIESHFDLLQSKWWPQIKEQATNLKAPDPSQYLDNIARGIKVNKLVAELLQNTVAADIWNKSRIKGDFTFRFDAIQNHLEAKIVLTVQVLGRYTAPIRETGASVPWDVDPRDKGITTSGRRQVSPAKAGNPLRLQLWRVLRKRYSQLKGMVMDS